MESNIIKMSDLRNAETFAYDNSGDDSVHVLVPGEVCTIIICTRWYHLYDV